MTRWPAFLALVAVLGPAALVPRAQQQPVPPAPPAPIPIVDVKAIDPGNVRLPPESATANETRFSFIAYGDTRGPADGYILQPMHGDVIRRMLEVIPDEARAGFPVRFVIQSGDAVVNGRYGNQFNVSFTPLIELLIREGRVPYFFAVGNHDVGGMPVGDPDRDLGLRNTTAAMSKLWPAENTPRRLSGYPAFSFGYGRFFFIALDSNIPRDPVQFEWVKHQLESLDRRRFPHVIAVFHHPPLTSGAHGGATLVEPQAQAMRELYMPLFRQHHVRMTIAGHDHLYDHFVEHYDDATGTHRMDHLVTGGGGAPIYLYRGEQDLAAYAATAAPAKVRVEHLVRPGSVDADNPHHFVVVEIDGDRIRLRPIATVMAPFLPYGSPTVDLVDK